MAFIWKDKKTKTWYLDYTPPSGKRVRKRVGKSKQAAQLALKEIEYQLSFDRAGVATPDVTLKGFLEKYRQTTEPKLRPVSWKRYRAIMDHFCAFLGPGWEKIKLQQLSREKFEQYVSWRRSGNGAFPGKNGNNKKPAKTKTVNTEMDMLASMLNKAVEWHYLSQNPAKSIPRLKEDDRKPFRFLSREEIDLLRLVADLLEQQAARCQIHAAVEEFYAKHGNLIPEAIRESRPGRGRNSNQEKSPSPLDSRVQGGLRNIRLIVDFLLTTGARKDEALSLEWPWLDLERGVVSFRRRANWVPKGTERDIALKSDLVKRFKKMPRVPDQHRIFLDWHAKPIPPRTFERGIQRLIELARIPPAGIHSFRHTFASHLVMAGVPLPTIQQLLGHKDIQTVMIYAHLSPSHVQESVKALPF